MNDLCKTDSGTELIAVSPKWRLQSANNRVCRSLCTEKHQRHIFSFLPSVTPSASDRPTVYPAAVDRPSAASQPPVFITLVVLFPAAAAHAVARLHCTGFVPRGLARSFPLSLPLFRNCTCNFTCRTGLRLKKSFGEFRSDLRIGEVG